MQEACKYPDGGLPLVLVQFKAQWCGQWIIGVQCDAFAPGMNRIHCV